MGKKGFGLALSALIWAVMLYGCAMPEAGRDPGAEAEPATLEAETEAGEQALADGIYSIEVSLRGGSGRASVKSPAEVIVKDGDARVRIEFSSPYYDYVLLPDGTRLEPVNTEGDSVFEIPAGDFGKPFLLKADTTAMSKPHEIEYELDFDPASFKPQDGEPARWEPEAGKAGPDSSIPQDGGSTEAQDWSGMQKTGSLELSYAREYALDYYGEEYALLSIRGIGKYLICEEGAAPPSGLDPDITVLQKPFHNIYLAASSTADYWVRLGALSSVGMVSTKEEDWSIPELSEAIRRGEILYAGRYSAPDYERLLSAGCTLAVENTMIFHSPEVKEKLEKMGIPVLIDHSSYESHPFGRLEWIRLYGRLLDCPGKADGFFEEQTALAEKSMPPESTGKRAAFFYFNSNGAVVVRRGSDYLNQMISMAGMEPVCFDEKEGNDPALSTMKVQPEEFYRRAKDAEVLIYNGSILGDMESLNDFLELSPLLKEFRAVKTGEVYFADADMYQQPTGIPELLKELSAIGSGTARDQMPYFSCLR